MDSSISLGLGPRKSLEESSDEDQSDQHDPQEEEEQPDNSIGRVGTDLLLKPSIPAPCKHTSSNRPTTSPSASVPAPNHAGTRLRPASFSAQVRSRPTLSTQIRSRRHSTAPPSINTTRPTSDRYLDHLRPTGALTHRWHDARRLLGARWAQSVSDLAPSPQSPDREFQHEPANLLGNGPAPAAANTTNGAGISGGTPKKQRGFRGVWRRFVGKVRGGGGEYGVLSAGRDGKGEEDE